MERREKEIAQLEGETLKPGFWEDNQRAQEVLKRINSLKLPVQEWRGLDEKREELSELVELIRSEDDQELLPEIEKEVESLKRSIEKLELRSILGGEDDAKNAILTIHPGAGGTESQDWAQMLLRMYLRWIERKGFSYQVMDLQPGEETGIKSAVVEVQGDYAYGYLKAEAGVHRLVRISPFDANRRRHTSFASVFVYPEIEDDQEIEINPKDLRIDTFRASGAGGQHVNKVSTAVRITHIPTGIVVQCQSERSQHMNKENAMKVLRARLYQRKKEEEAQKLREIEKAKKEIAWGSQIRSYVFHPYNLVKDHRTGIETSNIQAVMDGELDEFIRAYLINQRKVTLN